MKEIPLIDTNLLLLVVIGSVDHGSFISSSKRLTDFTFDDYKMLMSYISKFQNFATTPYILTEVSNLLDLHDSAADEAYKTLQAITELADVIEVIPRNDTQHSHFLQYGITDANILDIALTRPVVTNDIRLASIAYSLCPDENIVPWYLLKNRMD
ncbi:hypothetical protein [Dickeya dianthicola]|uniref:PIN domain-containing protein n=1 Tax=Dickeya dianthicola TaxID=204039 RepID=A0AAW4LFR9_9GAMM|nr:hypothetical protein [Dickeya dianthicola]MBT1427789.1 hypothetical protein [Dickeya dianthicola]MBT1431856.1 hypothetical protein [Dickeya dianthicola]MBT1459302.1 hypothetical protein [Dickeya dianthicola]MBT1488499.1 hypothetical protein [Dickeya dianthicola]MCA7004787.1 hypothetical protein [Dickeya dianthicola]